MRLPILMYHHIGPVIAGSWPSLTVGPEVFAGQVHWLVKHGYTGIQSYEWVEWVKTGKKLPTKPILLTFDDAYADLVDNAFSVLKLYEFKATVFVVTKHIGKSSTWDKSFGYPELPLMTREQILYWAHEGIEFGAHTLTHPDLRVLSPAALQNELKECKEDLAELLDAPQNHSLTHMDITTIEFAVKR